MRVSSDYLREVTGWGAICCVFLLACVQAQGQTADAGKPDSGKMLKGRGVLELASGERFCVPVPLHPSRTINLGAAQLTVTLSADKKPGEDVVLVSRLTRAQATLTSGDAEISLCGAVPELSAKQTGAYHASDYAIHLGSGNAANIGTPDDHLIDTEALANQLQDLHLKLVASPKR